ncbi:MAG: recombinase family protein [Sulfitobacter sp.]
MTKPRRIGYIRVSTRAQTTDRQTQQLEAECDEMHVEYVSAVADARPVFEGLLADLRLNDTFVVLDLDRAFRSSIDAMLTAEALRARGVTFRILSLQVDTSTPEGELFYSLLASFAQFERRLVSRRTREGLDAARKRGVKLGRPAKLTEDQIKDAHARIVGENVSCQHVASQIRVSRLTLQRAFRRLGLSYPLPT